MNSPHFPNIEYEFLLILMQTEQTSWTRIPLEFLYHNILNTHTPPLSIKGIGRTFYQSWP